MNAKRLDGLVFPMTIIAAWRLEDGRLRVQDQGGGALPLDYRSAVILRDALNEYIAHGEDYITAWREDFLSQEVDKEPSPVPSRKVDKSGYVYLIERDGHHKIGISKNPKSRISSMQTASSTPINLICTIATNDMESFEAMLHNHFADKRLSGEWFVLTPDDVEYIRGFAQ